MKHSLIPFPVKAWLWTGLVIIFFQILIGGITRLTGSGLSITKWEIVTGTLPPLNRADWEDAFSLYKETPQYQKINRGMSLGEFKWIYFWEYLHRLWARLMGFVFLLPFVFFWAKGYLNPPLKKDLVIVFILAGVVGAFGWIMVASGLIHRPWVNAYKLTLHLGLALVTLSWLWWVYLKTNSPASYPGLGARQNTALIFLVLVCIQILLGGMMSGMKAALVYPTFPKMNQYWIDPILFRGDSWKWQHFMDYDSYPFLPALVQVLHRITALVLLVLFFSRMYRFFHLKFVRGLAILLVIQVTLGIVTLLRSRGFIPVNLGVLHQAAAIVLLLATLRWWFISRAGSGNLEGEQPQGSSTRVSNK